MASGAPSLENLALPQVRTDYLAFEGGLDTETPSWDVPPGRAAQSKNFFIGITGDYQDTKGYERFDGQASPSAALYYVIDVTITGSFSIGDTITQLVTGATGVVLAIVTSGTPDYLVFTKLTGAFDATNALQVSGVTEGTATSLARGGGASTRLLNAQYKNLAADNYRSDISAIPGSGSVIGIMRLDDVKYGFRNNSGGTAAALYKSSGSGWTAVSLGFELDFTSGGTTAIVEGNTITGVTSGATALLTRVILESGSWKGGDAAGRFIFASQTGTFQAENLDVGASSNLATIAADSSAITLSPSGRLDWVTFNFGAAGGVKRIYGADGVNRGFEFDGTVFVPINSTMDTDTPLHVFVHRLHLFFSFDGSAQHSGIGKPYIWSPIFGAAELAIGDTITGFMREPGSEARATLGIYSRNTSHMLHGSAASGADKWNLVDYREEVGAIAYTIQQIGLTIFLDDRGVTNMRTVQAHGNFQHATLTGHIQSWINQRKIIAKASCISRDLNQYRLFFTDKYALYVTMDGTKIKGVMPMLFSHKVECIYSEEANNGSEEIFFGSDDGMVYQMEKGTSFDGDDISAILILHYHFSRSLRWLKKYLSAALEVTGIGYSSYEFSYKLSFGDANVMQPGNETADLRFTAHKWDAGLKWDSGLRWNPRALSPVIHDLRGDGENISFIIRKKSDYFSPLRFSGILFRYYLMRLLR